MVVSGCRKVKPIIVLVYIKKINIIAQQTNNNTNKKKKMVSRNSLHTRSNSSLRSDINLCIKLFCCPL